MRCSWSDPPMIFGMVTFSHAVSPNCAACAVVDLTWQDARPRPGLAAMSDATIPPDPKDWTWVLTRECPECHESAGQIEVARMPPIIGATVPRWRTDQI